MNYNRAARMPVNEDLLVSFTMGYDQSTRSAVTHGTQPEVSVLDLHNWLAQLRVRRLHFIACCSIAHWFIWLNCDRITCFEYSCLAHLVLNLCAWITWCSTFLTGLLSAYQISGWITWRSAFSTGLLDAKSLPLDHLVLNLSDWITWLLNFSDWITQC